MVGGVEPDSILAFFANVLPLAGCDVVEGMVASEFDAAVLVGCEGNQQLMKSTLQGENYIGMALARSELLVILILMPLFTLLDLVQQLD